MSDVLVVVGPLGGAVRKSDLAAVGFGVSLAEKSGGALDALVLGPTIEGGQSVLAHLGARSLYVLNHPDLEAYTAEAYARAVVAFMKEHGYRAIGAVSSSSAREFFPRLAAMLDVPMASDVLALEDVEPDSVVFTRGAFVGNLLAAVELKGPLFLATCRASEFQAPERVEKASPILPITVSESLGHERKRFVALSRSKSERPELTEADIVVSAGRGTKGPGEGLPLVEELADSMGAAMGATRAVVDAGWMPNEYQVGQTGKNVAPQLYLAVGLSGAIQHVSGMRSSKTIVAINKDPDAPIFEVANLGVVADLFEIVPALTKAVEEAKG